MPKFVEALSDDSDDDEEIQFVPYVKPPPPVIDILESSSSGGEDNTSHISRKKKNRKRVKRTQAQNVLSNSNISNGVNTVVCDNDAVPCPPIPEPITHIQSSLENADKNIRQMQNTGVSNGMDNEPNTNLNDGPTGTASTSKSSINAGVTSSLSESADLISSNVSTEPLPCIRIASSIFESNESAFGVPVSSETERAPGLGTVVGSTVSNINSVPGNPQRIGAQGKGSGRKSVSASAADGQGKKASQTKRKVKPTTPTRPRVSATQKKSATQRTNEEICNFLTTLGIYDPNEPPPVLPPIRMPRKKKSPVNVMDTTSAPATNFIPADALVDLLPPPCPRPPAPTAPIANSETMEMEVDEATVVGNSATRTTTPETSEASTGTAVKKNKENRSQNDAQAPVVPVPVPQKNPEKSIRLASLVGFETSDSLPLVPVVTFRNDGAQNQLAASDAPSSAATGEILQENLNMYIINNVHNPPPPYLPSHWNLEMVEYYDTPRNPDYRMKRVLDSLSDDPALWEVQERDFVKPKLKKIRCQNCLQWGHLPRHCTEKRKRIVCHLCGQDGHSLSGKRSYCPNARCLNCGHRQSQISHGCRNCTHTSRPVRCSICDTIGHDGSSCPDKWRRYFSTTQRIPDSNGDNGEENLQLYGDKPQYVMHRDTYCYNCSQKGHHYYHCRSSTRNDSPYTRQTPRILQELPIAPRNTQATSRTRTVSSTIVSDRVVVVDNDGMDEDCSMTIQVTNTTTISATATSTSPTRRLPVSNTSPNPTPAAAKSRGSSNSPRRCPDFPDCQNKPLLRTTCRLMFVVPSEHKLLLKAQAENMIVDIINRNGIPITVLHNQSVVHIRCDTRLQRRVEVIQEELMALIAKLKLEERTTTSPPSSVLQNVGSNSHTPKVVAEIIRALPPATEPVVITLDDEEEAQEIERKKNTLKVTLLESEWGLIFNQSLKQDGLISKLTTQFKVNIFVSKEGMTASIHDGTEENRKLAQKNIVFWLECQAANVDYIMQLDLNNKHFNPGFNSNQKRQCLEKRQRLQNRIPKSVKRARFDNNVNVTPPGSRRGSSSSYSSRSPDKRNRPPPSSRGNGGNRNRSRSNDRQQQGPSNNPRYFPNPHYSRNQNQQIPSLFDNNNDPFFFDFSAPTDFTDDSHPSFDNNRRGRVGDRGRRNDFRYFNADYNQNGGQSQPQDFSRRGGGGARGDRNFSKNLKGWRGQQSNRRVERGRQNQNNRNNRRGPGGGGDGGNDDNSLLQFYNDDD